MSTAGAGVRQRSFEVTSTGLLEGGAADPCVMVIFGAAGDLTRRDLLPSLFELHRKQLLPANFAVIGFSRRPWTSEQFRQEMRSAVIEHCTNCERGPANWDALARRVSYVSGDAESGDDYAALAREIARVQSEFGIDDNVFFHLAVPPGLFETIAGHLGTSGLARSDAGWRRLVVEKPFGENRESARQLDRRLRTIFDEEQIYRIDHFLGKDSVQNMLVFRFGNPSFEPIWNRRYIDHVQITVAEDLGIGTRAGFYEKTGVVRDMIQNHLLQLLCLTAIEPPVHYDAASLRDETVKVLEAVNVEPVEIDGGAVRGQYGPGRIKGEPARGYLEEDGVAAGSATVTFAAIKLTLDNWRWADVPFYLRTGKRLTRKLTEVAIEFKPTPHLMFPATGGDPRQRHVLVFRLQPDEGISQSFVAKPPGPDIAMQTVTMNFMYGDAFGIDEPPRAYAWLLLEVMKGDQTLFARADWIDKAWQIVDPIVERWTARPPADFPNYAAGTAGPEAAAELMRRDGRQWRDL